MTDPNKPVKVVVTKPWNRVLAELVVAGICLFILWRLMGSPTLDDLVTYTRGFVDFLGTNPTPAPAH